MAEKKKKRPSLALKTQRKVRKMSEVPDFDDSEYNEESANIKSGKSIKKSKLKYLKLIIPTVLIFSVLISYLIIGALHPVGTFEYIGSLFAAGGSGSGYDVDIFGGKPKYTLNEGDTCFVVTDTSVNCYNINGNTIFETSHAFSDPVVKTAETRYLIYGQGEAELSVSTLTESLFIRNFEKSVIAAAISDSGCFAVATKAEGYDSVVYVFDKDNTKIYEWYSSGETVNALALSADGETLAVSTVSVEDGNFLSNIYFLNFDSADAIMKYESTEDIVHGLYDSGSDRFCAAFSNNIVFFDYDEKTIIQNINEYSVSVVKQFGSEFVVLRNVAANQEQSIIEIYDNDGELISSFNVSNFVTDFSYRFGNLYLLGASKVYKYDTDGKLTAQADVNYDAMYIEAVSDDEVACVRNTTIEKIDLSESED